MKRFVWTIAVLLAVPAATWGQGTETSLDLQHYRPAAGVVQYLGEVRGAEIEPHQMVGFSLFVNYQHKPFLLTLLEDDGTGTGTRVPVTHDAIQYQVAADFLWSLGLFNFLQVGLGLPVILAQAGEGVQPAYPDRPTLASTSVRDLRIDIQARILGGGPRGTPGSGFGLSGALVLALPTGDSENFAGDKNVVAEPILIADYDLGFASVALNFGARLRDSSQFADYELSHQLTWGVGLAVKLLEQRLRILGEYTGLANVAGTTAVAQELRFGAGYTFDRNRDLTILAAGGFGIGDKPGVPEFRVLLSFVYAPLNRDDDEDKRGVDSDHVVIEQRSNMPRFRTSQLPVLAEAVEHLNAQKHGIHADAAPLAETHSRQAGNNSPQDAAHRKCGHDDHYLLPC